MQTAVEPSRPSGRKGRLLVLSVLVLAIATVSLLYWNHYLRDIVATDNAYVQGHVVPVSALTAGTVREVYVAETDHVKAGEALLAFDESDIDIQIQELESELAKTVREITSLGRQVAVSDAQVKAKHAEWTRANHDLERHRAYLERRAALASRGLTTQEDFRNAEAQFRAAEAQVEAARSQWEASQQQAVASRALLRDTSVYEHPSVLSQAARLREAWLIKQRAQILAPISGQVARRSAQPGQRVAQGSALMAIVPLDQLWVDANFKENQIAELRLDQPVSLSADLYGDTVLFRGKLVGISPGTGTAFSLLPAQQASGNWVKVVQRVPVRIALEAEDLKKHPLRVGLSMRVKVDVRRKEGQRLTHVSGDAAKAASAATKVLTPMSPGPHEDPVIQARIRKIIERHAQ
ncbi:MAG: HlyD family efflux transporter periplasmic adaptor subunit [Betaproteobacteria bacterium]|nr:efflux RND transporter periplasmic adaptor subunit [Pseudomonadota bacterium]NBO12116.1 HlyD family efflux transporter periplasmic adaptor subunit [Betaproteobacteria bacterium]NBO44951.1 HlyD family efflux transporter periplasmic adaptor subunit [Betaproteobacteria bacterium]NBP10607.1 HlyD family efflux transporter periplasmic adaptor subunit [Betaproteobacteria bacterium]NBP62362.1 HlyD family efflux transporter periplasmic adaptor subunit [Betaproteobacteria bacterium]